MRKTLIMFSLFFILVLCSFHSPAFAQDPGTPDKVRFLPWGTYVLCPPCTGRAVVPMIVVNDESLSMIQIPLYWTGPVRLDTVIFKGERSDFMTFKYCYIENSTKTALLEGGVSAGEPRIPPGDGILFYLYFTVQDTGTVAIDTISVVPDMFYFWTNSYQAFGPLFYSSEFHILPQSTPPGDVNFDGRSTVADVVWLINYLFKGGPPPSYMPAGDVNTDGKISISDVIYYINYFYKGGTVLGMGCAY
jgi:hypothetical protein